ncbi:hypothetical protein Q672_19015 [Marinobacter sp. EVN1]|nr:hypothetical protein Q672_19015 [Marinobacter sp. EVN1]
MLIQDGLVLRTLSAGNRRDLQEAVENRRGRHSTTAAS